MPKHYFSRINKTVVWEEEIYTVDADTKEDAEAIARELFNEYDGVLTDAQENDNRIELVVNRHDPNMQHLPVWAGYCALLFQNRVLSVIDKQFDIEIDPPFEAEG